MHMRTRVGGAPVRSADEGSGSADQRRSSPMTPLVSTTRAPQFPATTVSTSHLAPLGYCCVDSGPNPSPYGQPDRPTIDTAAFGCADASADNGASKRANKAWIPFSQGYDVARKLAAQRVFSMHPDSPRTAHRWLRSFLCRSLLYLCANSWFEHI
jgi:hypothetical protein